MSFMHEWCGQRVRVQGEQERCLRKKRECSPMGLNSQCFVGPRVLTLGILKYAARCVVPVLFPKNNLQLAIRAIVSYRLKLDRTVQGSTMA